MLSSRAVRRSAAAVLVTFTSLTLQPLQAAVQSAHSPSAAAPEHTQSQEERYSQVLTDIAERVETAQDQAKRGQRADNEIKALRLKKKDLAALETGIDADFKATEKHLLDKKLPAVILERHRAAMKEFKTRQAEFKALLQGLEDADDKKDEPAKQAKAKELAAFFEKHQQKKTHTPVDPNKLPFRTPEGKVRAPKESKKALQALFKPEPILLAGPALPGLLQVALTDTPTPDDLAPTEDVQITPAIRALAESLHKNPVKIYQWVRNNIQFIPTYGSIQGADMTLQTQRGNAFDTASLLIALLRYSGIPARYAYGTIQVPIEQVMNWVGGVTAPEAALQLLGQGGIPSIGLTSGGVFKAVKLEHVWVEAYVDYVPSRGAVNKQGDTWIPMDASFKQYQFKEGLDIKTAVPFDAQGLADQIKASAQINEAEGWVTGVNSSLIQTTLTTYQAQVQNYINTQKPHATVGEVLGTQTTILENFPHLMGTLPYQTLVKANVFTTIPDNLRHKFQFNLYASSLERALDTPTLTLNQSLPQLAGKKITLSYEPATPADAALIDSLLASNATRLPGYLIHLTAAIRIDGESVVRGGHFTLGQELTSTMGLFDPSRNGWELVDNKPVAGEMTALGIDAAGVAQARLKSTQQSLQDTASKIKLQPDAAISREESLGNLLHGTLLTYFGMLDNLDNVAQKQNGTISYRAPSFGTYGSALKVSYWFGLPRSVQGSGLSMDIDHSANIVDAKNGDAQKRRDYALLLGSQGSAMEHGIPEMVHSTQLVSAQGISTIKLFSLANQQGIKIYHITRSNIGAILPLLSVSPDVKSEINNAINSGKEVTIPQRDLTLGSWIGVGYTVIDPATGAGGYLISGGSNGGFLEALDRLIELYVTKLTITAKVLEQSSELIDAIGNWGTLAGFVLGLVDIITKCSGSALTAVVIAYTFATIAAILIAAAFTTFIVVLAVALVLTEVVGAFKNFLLQSHGCNNASIRRTQHYYA